MHRLCLPNVRHILLITFLASKENASGNFSDAKQQKDSRKTTVLYLLYFPKMPVSVF
jgi:hypothetical protein